MIEASAYDDDEARTLMRQIAAGRQAAFERLYRMLSRRVYAFVQRGLDNPGVAEEVMMDTMYEVWTHAGRYRGEARVSTWVLGIARNKMLMSLRGGRERPYEDVHEFAEILEADTPDGLEALQQRQDRDVLHRCLRTLSWAHRECLHLLHFEDWSVAEIAATVGVPEGTVKSRLSQARSRLAACVGAAVGRTGEACAV